MGLCKMVAVQPWSGSCRGDKVAKHADNHEECVQRAGRKAAGGGLGPPGGGRAGQQAAGPGGWMGSVPRLLDARLCPGQSWGLNLRIRRRAPCPCRRCPASTCTYDPPGRTCCGEGKEAHGKRVRAPQRQRWQPHVVHRPATGQGSQRSWSQQVNARPYSQQRPRSTRSMQQAQQGGGLTWRSGRCGRSCCTRRRGAWPASPDGRQGGEQRQRVKQAAAGSSQQQPAAGAGPAVEIGGRVGEGTLHSPPLPPAPPAPPDPPAAHRDARGLSYAHSTSRAGHVLVAQAEGAARGRARGARVLDRGPTAYVPALAPLRPPPQLAQQQRAGWSASSATRTSCPCTRGQAGCSRRGRASPRRGCRRRARAGTRCPQSTRSAGPPGRSLCGGAGGGRRSRGRR